MSPALSNKIPPPSITGLNKTIFFLGAQPIEIKIFSKLVPAVYIVS